MKRYPAKVKHGPAVVLCEIRASDSGKLLFRLGEQYGRRILLIKVKGDPKEYSIDLEELNAS